MSENKKNDPAVLFRLPFMPQHYFFILAFLLGCLNVFAFAPFKAYVIALALPGIFWCLIAHPNNQHPLKTAWLFGLGYFALGITWIRFAVNQVAYHAWYGWALWLLLVVFLAALFVVQAWGWRVLRSKVKPWLYPCLFALLWCVHEWVRAYLLGGFPWLWVSYTQTTSALKGWIPLIGAPGLSFLVVFLSVWTFICLFKQSAFSVLRPLFVLCLFFVGGLALTSVDWTVKQSKPLRVGLVQGNVSLASKWNPAAHQSIYDDYLLLSRPYLDREVDLLVWPEAALPGIWGMKGLKKLETQWQQFGKHTQLVTGVFLASRKGQKTWYSNAVVSLGPSPMQVYQKRRLVPFGEYTPLSYIFGLFKKWLVFPMSDLVAGATKQPAFKVRGVNLAPFVCYEIAFPSLMMHHAEANMLLVLTDDVWFGRSWAAYQHLQIAQVRALETGKPVLFATNSGITAFIDRWGVVKRHLPYGVRRVLSLSVLPYEGATPYIRLLSSLGLLF